MSTAMMKSLSRNSAAKKPAILLPRVNVYPHRSLSIISARLYPKSEGAIRESDTAFSKKEKAAEDQWARQRVSKHVESIYG